MPKSTIIKKDNRNFGLITLPKFYVDFNDYKEINCAKDVKNEIIKLKEQNIEGLVLDLRNNGGGALQTVVEMTGLFIETGPVVQVKSIGQ
jgi:carboxyl-terminal processing protease